jgi:malate synthase
MEDVATAEISRAQLWQWLHHPKGILSDGRKLTDVLFEQLLDEELNKIRSQFGEAKFEQGRFQLAKELFSGMTISRDFVEFLTIPSYAYL